MMAGREENYRPPEEIDYFEWKALLDSVENAANPYVMVDLGAGYGWWGINAAAALKGRNASARARIIMVEGDANRYEYLQTAISDNPFPGISFDLVQAAVGVAAGTDWFYTGRTKEWGGQRLMLEYHRDLLLQGREEHVRREGEILKTSDGYELVQVRVVPLEEILADSSYVDLLDMDIQGTELEIIQAARELIREKCRRLFISTHGDEIHADLLTLLTPDWDLVASFPPHAIVETDVGNVQLLDGVQHWITRR